MPKTKEDFWNLPIKEIEDITGLTAPDDNSNETLESFREKAWESYRVDIENKMEWGTARQGTELPDDTKAPEEEDAEGDG